MCGFYFLQFSGFRRHVCQHTIESKNSALPTLYSVVDKTENRNWILVRCKLQFWFRLLHCQTITSGILCRFSSNFVCGSEVWSLHRVLLVRQNGSSYPILEVCEFRFCHFRLWSPCLSTYWNKIAYRAKNWAMPILYSVVDYTGNGKQILVRCKFRFWLWLLHCRTFTSTFFLDFYQKFAWSWKCCSFDAHSLWHKREVDIWY